MGIDDGFIRWFAFGIIYNGFVRWFAMGIVCDGFGRWIAFGLFMIVFLYGFVRRLTF